MLIFVVMITLGYIHPYAYAQAATTDLCCPQSYSRSIWECPFDAYLPANKNMCCKRTGFGKYNMLPKVPCSSMSSSPLPIDSAVDLCVFEKNQDKCLPCATSGGLWTALGCIQIDSPTQLFGTFISFGVTLAGIISFVLMLFGALQMMTSAGNPEKLNSGKELLSSAITGLLLIIFSVFILRLIGYNILGIPGFG